MRCRVQFLRIFLSRVPKAGLGWDLTYAETRLIGEGMLNLLKFLNDSHFQMVIFSDALAQRPGSLCSDGPSDRNPIPTVK
jgi:hypothetical protein